MHENPKQRKIPRMAYKDSFFRSIFNDAESALALYRALDGGPASNLAAGARVEMKTLGESLWSSRRNDLSFIVDDSLVVIAEHQSTVNENMPYRMLRYACRLLDDVVVDGKSLYRSARVQIPRLRFITLYNGPAQFPDRKTMLLSEAFKHGAGYDGISLELKVEVFNVNEGRNHAILESCGNLKGYAFFVERARRAEAELTERGKSRREATQEAIRHAIKECREAGLLLDFWARMSQEDINMLVAEWNMETALEVREEEGFERGMEIGERRGVEIGERRGVALGHKAILELIDKGYTVEELARELKAKSEN